MPVPVAATTKLRVVAPDGALRLQLVQNLLLVGVGCDIHGVHLGVVGVEVFFRLQRPSQPLLLLLGVVFKFRGIPVALEGGGDLVDGLSADHGE